MTGDRSRISHPGIGMTSQRTRMRMSERCEVMPMPGCLP